MPLARSTEIGSTFDCADHSKRVCFFERAIISSPVIDFFSVSIAIRYLLSSGAANWTAYLNHEGTKGTKGTKGHEEETVCSNRFVRPSSLRDFVVTAHFFSIASRFALNSFPGFHSGILSACATR